MLPVHRSQFYAHVKQVIIYGDELVSKSLAYHLSNSGLASDVLVIRGNGTQNGKRMPSFNPHLNSFYMNHLIVSNPRSSLLIRHSTELFNMTKCGAIYLAQTEERVKSFKRMISISKLFIPKEYGSIELLSPEEIKKKYDYLDGEEDKLEKHARSKGIKFFDEFILKKVHVDNDTVSHVELIHPTTKEVAKIRCEYFVNSANSYLSRNIGKCSTPRVRIPTLACEHQILVTKPFEIPGCNPNELLPIINDFDNRFTVYQQSDGSFSLTGYEKISHIVRKLYKPRASGEGQLVDFEVPIVPERWQNFYYILDPIVSRIPALRDAEYQKLHPRAENFTPDGRPLIGEVSEIKNYLIAAAVWPSLTAGSAQLLADIILRRPSSYNHDFWSLDPKRFVPLHSNRIFLFDRLREIPAKSRYNIFFPTPHNSYQTGHGLRRSPLYNKLKEAGGYFTQIMGYERPGVYLTKETEPYKKELEDCGILVANILETPSFGKPHWFNAVQNEYFACRERVALLDYSSFTKISISSPHDEALDFLQYMCAVDINMPVGTIRLSGMQNSRGGYENDVSLIRLAENHFFMIAPTEQQARCYSWLRSNLHADSNVSIQNVSADYTAICIMGPYSKLLLIDAIAKAALASGAPIEDYLREFENFPFFTFKTLPLGTANVPVLACNLTHTGELGFVLYMRNPQASAVYQTLLDAGAKYGVQHAGSIVVRCLRIEKFLAFWGQDLDTTTTPFECGRGFRVCFDKDFLGREALLKQKAEGVRRRYVQLVLDSFDSDKEPIWPWGGEPIYLEGGSSDTPVGMTTTTSYGFTLGRMVALGYIRHPDNEFITNDFLLGNNFEVDVGGKRFSAHINLHSPKLTDTSGQIEGSYMHSAKS
ncbi:hypothetical protein TYRP_017428 [Tyrophagus putrescentiae]|nr:hypothetical protein TYRP_017428 [Tyrophagus putrescentiae]